MNLDEVQILVRKWEPVCISRTPHKYFVFFLYYFMMANKFCNKY
jgi:hypothetical protein